MYFYRRAYTHTNTHTHYSTNFTILVSFINHIAHNHFPPPPSAKPNANHRNKSQAWIEYKLQNNNTENSTVYLKERKK